VGPEGRRSCGPTERDKFSLKTAPVKANRRANRRANRSAYLLPQPQVNYAVPGDDLYMFRRKNGIVLGGTHMQGDWSLILRQKPHSSRTCKGIQRIMSWRLKKLG